MQVWCLPRGIYRTEKLFSGSSTVAASDSVCSHRAAKEASFRSQPCAPASPRKRRYRKCRRCAGINWQLRKPVIPRVFRHLYSPWEPGVSPGIGPAGSGCPPFRLSLDCLRSPRYWPFSPYIEPYLLKDFSEDLAAVADLKKIARFGLIGWSSGVPPVIATNYYFPQRVAFTFAVSGYTDFSRFPDAKKFMADKGLPGSKLAENHPLAFSLTVWGVRRADLHRPDFYLQEALEKMPSSDRQMLDSPASACLFIRTQQEGLQQGSDGAVQDLKVAVAILGL